MLDNMKKYWVFVLLIFAIGGWVANIRSDVASAAEKNASQDESIKLLTEIAQSNTELLKEMKGQFEGQMDLILMVLGITVSDTIKHRWTVMPKYPPVDSLGWPIEGAEWLSIAPNKLVGKTMKWVNEDTVLVRYEWDERSHVQ